ncbi:MAG: RagB/SusD family nutrient uptake outer membrane protein [Bacteroidota bacterium]|nr:RagB/SusD family nutrient uptake outer membrane protein [Bacteroidota bacterium]
MSEVVWVGLYQSIRNANLVIMNAPNAKQLTADDITKYVGEAKFMRAFSYFLLVKNWGGVPIRTEENITEIDVARSSADDVYSLILSDLKDAEGTLPDIASLPGKPSKWAAKTLLADVYFYRGMNSEAAGKANEVIAANKYSLVQVTVLNDFYKLYGVDVVTSTEEIFYIKYSHENGTLYPMMLHHPNSKMVGGGGYYGIYTDKVSNGVMKNWDMNDLRRQLWYNWDIGLGNNTLLTLKFIDPKAPGAGANATDIPAYRFADVLLMSAEAEVRSTGIISVTAMERLNMVHRRAYGYPISTASIVDFKITEYTKDSFLDLVIKERGYETVCEGKRWIDLKRLGAVKLREIIKAGTGRDVVDKHFLFPIPVAELSYNKKIDPAKDQNPGY